MQGATCFFFVIVRGRKVSIHAPYAGSDALYGSVALDEIWVSIHAPYAGSDRMKEKCHIIMYTVSIHAPYAGSDSNRITAYYRCNVSIHAPYAGSDSAETQLL